MDGAAQPHSLGEMGSESRVKLGFADVDVFRFLHFGTTIS